MRPVRMQALFWSTKERKCLSLVDVFDSFMLLGVFFDSARIIFHNFTILSSTVCNRYSHRYGCHVAFW